MEKGGDKTHVGIHEWKCKIGDWALEIIVIMRTRQSETDPAWLSFVKTVFPECEMRLVCEEVGTAEQHLTPHTGDLRSS
jgi:hypothetical protein